MDRTSVAVLLYLGTAWSAPRDNSGITYVRIQPITGQHAPRTPLASLRESRIENLPLTIGSREAVRRVRSDDRSFTTPGDVPDTGNPYQGFVPETPNPGELQTPKTANLYPEEKVHTTSYPDEKVQAQETLNYNSNDLGLTVAPEESEPKEPKFYEKRVPGPRFYSKLSYFSKPTEELDSPLSTNLVGHSSRRKYRSRCRCERIWNCPKLQITVPRCPEEYFLCCF